MNNLDRLLEYADWSLRVGMPIPLDTFAALVEEGVIIEELDEADYE